MSLYQLILFSINACARIISHRRAVMGFHQTVVDNTLQIYARLRETTRFSNENNTENLWKPVFFFYFEYISNRCIRILYRYHAVSRNNRLLVPPRESTISILFNRTRRDYFDHEKTCLFTRLLNYGRNHNDIKYNIVRS